MFPLEFHIEETPKSSQATSASKEIWKRAVKEAADARVRETVEWSLLDDRPVAVTIFYFAPSVMQGDIDNIIKPILDGMIGSAYLDDVAVERVVAQKFEPGVERAFRDVTPTLAATLNADTPVVYVRVDDDLSWRSL